MQFNIAHTIRYTFSRAVFLEPHLVRMQPRSCGSQSLRDFSLQVEPTPAGISHGLDAEGNHVASVWFDGQHGQLTVTAHAVVHTRRMNPFDYLLPSDGILLPMKYDESTAQLTLPARQREPAPARQDVVGDFADNLRERSGGQLLAFLAELNATMYKEFACIRRDEGEPWPPDETFARRDGACRDLAVLFVDVCRSVGIAARFVSGYQEGDTDQERRDLHAWAEAYIPGGGWRGYDPIHGLAVSDRHVAVAASAFSKNAAAVSGSFRGSDATSTMTAEIDLHSGSRSQQQQIQQQEGRRSDQSARKPE